MLSMTGYSSLVLDVNAFTAQIDIRSINSKYSDLRLNAPFCDQNFFEELRALIRAHIYRGQVSVDITLGNESNDNTNYHLNIDQLEKYVRSFENHYVDVPRDYTHLVPFLEMPGVTETEQLSFDAERDGDILKKAVLNALEAFYSTRETEGRVLCADLKQKLARLDEIRLAISDRVPDLEKEYRARLEKNIRELLEGAEVIDDTRILTEIAVFAAKTSIDEELVRLESHLAKITALVGSNERYIGKTLDFYMQEINRECNTIASKINDVSVSELVVESKVLIDQIREQAQNII